MSRLGGGGRSRLAEGGDEDGGADWQQGGGSEKSDGSRGGRGGRSRLAGGGKRLILSIIYSAHCYKEEASDEFQETKVTQR